MIFDRSWYNRAGVEPVMGFCTPQQYKDFLREVPLFENMISNSDIIFLNFIFQYQKMSKKNVLKNVEVIHLNNINYLLWIKNRKNYGINIL